MSDYLPAEVLIDILTRLPVHTILVCTSVCKSWYSLITNPTFISAHLNHKISNNDTHLLVRHVVREYSHQSENYSVHSNQTFDVCYNLTLPLYSIDSYFRIVGISNGLVCLSDDQFSYRYTMLLWNPSIRKFVHVPRPNVTYVSQGPYQHSLGFGFTPSTNDYKIVRVVYLDCIEVPPKVELYELSTGSWRNIDCGNLSYIIHERSPQAFLNGAAHWVGIDGDVKIVSFDMVNEVFSLMMLPNGMDPWNSRVAVYKDSLSLIHQTYGNNDHSCCIWVMKEYGVVESWTKQFTINLKQSNLRTPFGFRGNGDVLLATQSDDLVSYDPNEKQTTGLGINGWAQSFYVDTFVESLVLLERKPNFGDTATRAGIKRKLGTKKLKMK